MGVCEVDHRLVVYHRRRFLTCAKACGYYPYPLILEINEEYVLIA